VASWLIASWGNPFQWDSAKYILHPDGPSSVERTTLPLLVEASKASGATVIVPDTLVAARKGARGCVPPGHEPLTSASSYEEVREAARRLVEEWIHHCTGGAGGPLRVVVAPGIGRYTVGENRYLEARYARGLRAAPAEAYWAVAALETLRALREGVDHLIVDLTHGVNYMPSELYHATRYAASLHAVASGGGVSLEYYNSTPYPPGYRGDKPPILPVYKVAEEKITPQSGALYLLAHAPHNPKQARNKPGLLAQTRDSSYKLEKNILEERNRLRREAMEIVGEGLLALSVAFVAAPLATLLVRVPSNPLEHTSRIVEESLGLQWAAVRVGEEGGGIIVEHVLSVRRRGVQTVLLAGAMLEYVARIMPAETFTVEGAVCARLDVLKRTVEDMVFPNKMIAEHELDNIQQKCLEGTHEGCPLRELGHGACQAPNRRNLYAHAGLESNVTRILRGEGALCYPEECKEKVKDMLFNVLNGLLSSGRV